MCHRKVVSGKSNETASKTEPILRFTIPLLGLCQCHKTHGNHQNYRLYQKNPTNEIGIRRT